MVQKRRASRQPVGRPSNPGPGDLPKFQAVRRRLPDRALVRPSRRPSAIERLLASAPRPNDSSDLRIVALLARYLAAVDYAGAALSWGTDTIVVHVVETLDPSRLDPSAVVWAGDSPASSPACVACPQRPCDGLGARHPMALGRRLPARPQRRPGTLAHLEAVASGLLLGQDLCTRACPAWVPA